jgi:hypothetical protein
VFVIVGDYQLISVGSTGICVNAIASPSRGDFANLPLPQGGSKTVRLS